MRITRFTVLLLIALFGALSIIGSGGGGGGDSTVQSDPDQAMGGIWFGTGTNALEPGVVKNVVAFSTDAGVFRFLTDEGTQSIGSMSVNGKQITGTSVDYAPLGSVFLNGLPTTTGTYNGTIVERQSIDGTWRSSAGDSGDFVLIYDDRHAIPSSLATVSGTYTGLDQFGVPDLTLTVNGAGNITGSDSDGCIYSGSVQIIDSRYNVYRLNVIVGNCGQFDGSYTGLGGYDPSDSSFAFQIDNTLFIISNEIYK